MIEMNTNLEFWIQGELVSLNVLCEFEPDYPVRIESCRLRQSGSEQCLFNLLTPEQFSRLQQDAVSHLHHLADRKEAMEEDAADTMGQIAREMQQEYLETADRQRRIGA